MRLRWFVPAVIGVALLGGCADDTDTDAEGVTTTEPTTTEPERSTTSEAGSQVSDDRIQALESALSEQGLDPNLASFGVEWCTHQDLAMLVRETGLGFEEAERLAAAASETVC